MKRFEYSDEDRQEILHCLKGPVFLGTKELSLPEVIAVMEARAEIYLDRLSLAQRETVKGINLKIDSVRRVAAMLTNHHDASHLKRLEDQIRKLQSDLFFVERPKARRARMRFMLGAFEVFAQANHHALTEIVVLSESDTPAARFFWAAIHPVCVLAGEKIELQQAIKLFNKFKDEMRKAEIETIKAEIECVANDIKN